MGNRLRDFKYLEGTMHYDHEDDEVYRCHEVAIYDYGAKKHIVVYRSKLCTNGKFGQVDYDDQVTATSVVRYKKSRKNNAIMNKRLGKK